MLTLQPAFSPRTAPDVSYILTNAWTDNPITPYGVTAGGTSHKPLGVHSVGQNSILILKSTSIYNTKNRTFMLELHNISNGSMAIQDSLVIPISGKANHPSGIQYSETYCSLHTINENTVSINLWTPVSWTSYGGGYPAILGYLPTWKEDRYVYSLTDTTITLIGTEEPVANAMSARDYMPIYFDSSQDYLNVERFDFGDGKYLQVGRRNIPRYTTGSTELFGVRGLSYNASGALTVVDTASLTASPLDEYYDGPAKINYVQLSETDVMLTFTTRENDTARSRYWYRLSRYIISWVGSTITITLKENWMSDTSSNGYPTGTVQHGTKDPVTFTHDSNPVSSLRFLPYNKLTGKLYAQGNGTDSTIGPSTIKCFCTWNGSSFTKLSSTATPYLTTPGPSDTEDSIDDSLYLYYNPHVVQEQGDQFLVASIQNQSYLSVFHIEMVDFDLVDFTTEETFGVYSTVPQLSSEESLRKLSAYGNAQKSTFIPNGSEIIESATPVDQSSPRVCSNTNGGRLFGFSYANSNSGIPTSYTMGLHSINMFKD